MTVKIYKFDISPPVRAVLMACDIFAVQEELIDVDLLKQEHLAPQYLEKNPLHAVPMLEDGQFILHDSGAILMYLADVYGKDDSFYPQDIKQRALVNQKIFFNTSILYSRLRNITYPAFIEGVRKPAEKLLKEVVESYDLLETFLSRSKFLALNHLTIADVAAVATVTSLNILIPIDRKKYVKIHAWLQELEKQSFYQKRNVPGLSAFEHGVRSCLDL